jgi:hypothetical protein
MHHCARVQVNDEECKERMEQESGDREKVTGPHISQAKLDILQVALRCFRPRLFEQLLCEINP